MDALIAARFVYASGVEEIRFSGSTTPGGKSIHRLYRDSTFTPDFTQMYL